MPHIIHAIPLVSKAPCPTFWRFGRLPLYCPARNVGKRSEFHQKGSIQMTEIKATNITWHEGHVSREDRQKMLKQKGTTIWFTGLSGSGKSTIAFTVEHALLQRGNLAYTLDGDNIR